MPVRGDFQGLADLRAKLAGITGPPFRLEAAQVLAEAAAKQVDDEFRESRSPYGTPWAPLTSRTGKPLLDTGAHLRNTLAPKVSPLGFTISTAFKGAAVHQYGAVIKAKTSNGLRFRTRGAPTKRNPRGKLSGWIRKQQVTIPQRQFMPEGDVGPIWRPALMRAADDFFRARMGQP